MRTPTKQRRPARGARCGSSGNADWSSRDVKNSTRRVPSSYIELTMHWLGKGATDERR
jgi:hypothetical protein